MTIASPSIDLDHLLASLGAIETTAGNQLSVIEGKLPELRRQAHARGKRRGGAGSADAEKYALGSVLALLGFTGTDDLALLGLLSNPDQALAWLVAARVEHGRLTMGELIKAAIADPRRHNWCRQWGQYRWKAYKKPLYDATVTSFIESGRTGQNEDWRGFDVSDEQADVIIDICRALDEPLPDLATRGEAFEWIYERGGKPEYWEPPVEPPEWSD